MWVCVCVFISISLLVSLSLFLSLEHPSCWSLISIAQTKSFICFTPRQYEKNRNIPQYCSYMYTNCMQFNFTLIFHFIGNNSQVPSIWITNMHRIYTQAVCTFDSCNHPFSLSVIHFGWNSVEWWQITFKVNGKSNR